MPNMVYKGHQPKTPVRKNGKPISIMGRECNTPPIITIAAIKA